MAQNDSLRKENDRLRQTIQANAAHHQKVLSFGMQAREIDSPKQEMRAEDLVAHFENFDMEQLGGSGGPKQQRSLTERQLNSPDKAVND